MKDNHKKRNLWQNLLLAFAGVPATVLISFLIIGGFVIIGDMGRKIDLKAKWWSILIGAFGLSLIYAFTEEKVRQIWKRNKLASALLLYWQAQIREQKKSEPEKQRMEITRENLIDRLKVWEWSDPQYWSQIYPEEKHSENPFGIVDSLMAKYEKWEQKYKSGDLYPFSGSHRTN